MSSTTKTSPKICVIGAGSWGTAISSLLAAKGLDVTLWGRDKKLIDNINKCGKNPRYLQDELLPPGLKAGWDPEKASRGAKIAVFVVPSHAMRETAVHFRKYLKEGTYLMSLTKGIEGESLLRMSEVLSSVFPEKKFPVAVLSGPNHSEEVIKNIPSATVIASRDEKAAELLQDIFMTPYFRVYTNPDVTGVELGGATKNVIAIAVGISDGLGYGDNSKASLMTRGLAEMTRLGIAMGANPMTFVGLSGMGDLIATCISRYSRNRFVGFEIGRGKKLPQILEEMDMVAEGVKTSRAVVKMAARKKVEMPITRLCEEILYHAKDPRQYVGGLMTRKATSETKELDTFLRLLKE